MIKTQAPFDDGNVHHLEIDICGYNNHRCVVSQGPRDYFFTLPVNGCTEGYTSWTNADTWDFVSEGGLHNEIDLEIRMSLDDAPVTLTDAALVELEFALA